MRELEIGAEIENMEKARAYVTEQLEIQWRITRFEIL